MIQSIGYTRDRCSRLLSCDAVDRDILLFLLPVRRQHLQILDLDVTDCVFCLALLNIATSFIASAIMSELSGISMMLSFEITSAIQSFLLIFYVSFEFITTFLHSIH